jgi:hypothetical protein
VTVIVSASVTAPESEASKARALALPRRALWVLCLYGLLALLVVPVFPHFPSPNEFSRWALTVSIVERGSFEVGPLTALISDRIEDFSEVGGRIYSNKAPGGSLVAVPAYALARALVGPPTADNLRATVTAMRLAVSTLPLVLLALAFVRQARRLEVAPERIIFMLAVMLFGTPIFAYGMMLFSHVLTAAALFGAWLLLFGDAGRRLATRELAAGALLGLAAISEYPTAIPAMVLVLCAFRGRGLLGLARIAAGALPLAAALAFYNLVAFGGVFALSSSFERVAAFQQMSQAGLWGVGPPSPSILARLLLDPGKGLLILSPVLVLALVAIPAARRRLAPAAFWSLVLTPLALLLVYAGYANWHGGWTVGVRYLLPCLPFLAFLMLFGRPRVIDAPLLGASVAAVVLTSLVFPFVSGAYAFPWASFATPLLAKGLVAPNLLHLLSRTLAVTVPFVVVGIALYLTLNVRRFVLMAAGLVVWLMVGFLGVATFFPDSDGSRWYVERVYFEQPADPDEPVPAPDSPIAWKMRRDLATPPSSWQF